MVNEDPASPRPPGPCANCGAEVPERYCSRCAQDRGRTPHVPLGEIAGEALGEVLSVDGRMARTVIPFFLRPGFLAAEFLAGRRVRYSSPLRLYLLTSVVLLVTTSIVGLPDSPPPRPGAQAGCTEPPDPARQERITALMDDLRAEYGALGTRAAEHVGALRHLPRDEFQLRIEQSWFAQAPRVAFFLLPVMAGLLWLLHLRAGFYFAEHLVVATHAQALGFAALVPAAALHSKPAFFAGVVFAAGHLLLGMRRVYRRSWAGTVLRFALFAVAYTGTILVSFRVARLLALSFA